MNKLSEKSCEACRSDAPRVSSDEIDKLKAEIPDWSIVSVENIDRLSRTYTFKNFKEALDFTNRIGALAESTDHHPAILTEWGKVTVSWWTHKIKGLHMNDFVMAAKTDTLFSKQA